MSIVHAVAADGLPASNMNKGWLTPRLGPAGDQAAGTPTTISSLYRDDVLDMLERAVICTPNMTFHDCERHHHVK